MKNPLVMALAVFVSVSLASELRADIVYNNFGPGDSFITNQGLIIGTSGSNHWEQGSSFQVSGGDFALDSVEAAFRFSSGNNQGSMSLYSISGGLPSTLIETATASGFSTSPSIETFIFSGTSIMQDGETYALIASADMGSQLGWFISDSGGNGRIRRANGGTWNSSTVSSPAFRVNGSLTAIPEPTTLLILGPTMIGLSFTSRRRRIA